MKAHNDIEEQLRLIDDFFAETPKEIVDKMFQEAKESNPDDISFEAYCGGLERMLSDAVEEHSLSAPIVLPSISITTITIGTYKIREKYDDVISYRNDQSGKLNIKAA